MRAPPKSTSDSLIAASWRPLWVARTVSVNVAPRITGTRIRLVPGPTGTVTPGRPPMLTRTRVAQSEGGPPPGATWVMSTCSTRRGGAVMVRLAPITGAPGTQAVSGLPSTAWEARMVGRSNACDVDVAVT